MRAASSRSSARPLLSPGSRRPWPPRAGAAPSVLLPAPTEPVPARSAPPPLVSAGTSGAALLFTREPGPPQGSPAPLRSQEAAPLTMPGLWQGRLLGAGAVAVPVPAQAVPSPGRVSAATVSAAAQGTGHGARSTGTARGLRGPGQGRDERHRGASPVGGRGAPSVGQEPLLPGRAGRRPQLKQWGLELGEL